jgi:hypothetical protein
MSGHSKRDRGTTGIGRLVPEAKAGWWDKPGVQGDDGE